MFLIMAVLVNEAPTKGAVIYNVSMSLGEGSSPMLTLADRGGGSDQDPRCNITLIIIFF